MRIIITEEQKKKLFIPRKLSGEGSRWGQWNKEQPIKDGRRINQYDNEGIKQGYWETYWENGEIESKGNYVNGIQDGYWEDYWSNGGLYYKGSFKNGRMNGPWEWYYRNGNISSKNNYSNDKKNGVNIDYYENGGITFKGYYENDQLIEVLPITESEEPKKKLFIPRKIEDRYSKWNEQQPTITLDNHTFKLNQYDHNGNQIGIWLDNPEIINKNYIKTKPFMEELFNNLKVVKSPKGRNTNYKLNNKIIFQNRGDEILIYFLNDFWKGFREKYNIFTYDTKDLIKVWMEIKYGLGHLYPNQER